MARGRFEQSENGGAWEEIDSEVLYRRLGASYRNPDEMIEAMHVGQKIETPTASYRWVKVKPRGPRREEPR